MKEYEDQDWIDEIISCIDDGEIYPCLDDDYPANLDEPMSEEYVP